MFDAKPQAASPQRFMVRRFPKWDAVTGENRPLVTLVPVEYGNPVGETFQEAFRAAKREAGWGREVPDLRVNLFEAEIRRRKAVV